MALQRNIIQNTITKNLSLPLNIDTEENWADAFWGMELLQYQSPWATGRINLAFESFIARTPFFQKALLELVSANYPGMYVKQVSSLLSSISDMKTYAMAAEYIMRHDISLLPDLKTKINNKIKQLVKGEKDAAIAHQLFNRVNNLQQEDQYIPLEAILHPGFLKNATILFSFQRKNRDYPGIAVIRDSAGDFILDDKGTIFSVPQLGRSISNLPGYLTNGNTPQGIFRMFGFDTSKTTLIGPTTNIQLTMPFETSLQHFFRDSTITDTNWTEKWYSKLVPGKLKNNNALYEAFYAGKAGRTEIIAHGTTVDPDYYKDKIYYPQTPTMGCLCTKETWSDITGERLESDQAKLVEALQKAGGPDGYCVVIELNDKQQPVSVEDILPWIINQSE